MSKKQKTPTRRYLQVDYRIINAPEKKQSKTSQGRLYHVHRSGFWMDVVSVEVEGMHISFGTSTLIRNTLELEIHTVRPIDKIVLKGEVEWYELIPTGREYAFNVGVSILEISEANQKKFDKLFSFYKETMDVG